MIVSFFQFIILDNGIDEDTIHQKHENLKQKYQKASQELLSLKSKYEINEDSINPENELLNDIKYLFVSEQHADVIFRVEEEHLLYAHRAILSGKCLFYCINLNLDCFHSIWFFLFSSQSSIQLNV